MSPRRPVAFPATILFGAITIGLGFAGHRALDPGLGFADALYESMQLLTLEYNGPREPPWQLEVARYLGALTLALAVIAILAAFARDRADRLRTRLLTRGHHVVVGLGTRGVSATGRLAAAGRRVVAVDVDRHSPGALAARAEGVPVIVGDAREARTYRDAAAPRARHVLISLGEDSLNLQALESCLAAIPDRGPVLHVAIDGHLLWRELHRSALTWDGQGATVEFISLPDRVASRLVEEAAPDLANGRIIVWGDGPAAVRTAVHAVRWVLLSGDRPRLELAGPHGPKLESELARTEPWLARAAAIRCVAEPEGVDPGAAFVVGVSHADALAGASALARRLDRAAIIAEVPWIESVAALRRSGYPVDRVRFVDAEAQVLGPALFERSARELIARARHAEYVDRERRKGVTPDQNPSMRPWEELSDSLRESNRRFADSVGRRLADLDAELEPLAGPVEPPRLDPALIEELARVEHDRWVEDLTADGWRHHDGDKDPERKLHPLLVGWDQLDEAERDKDRDSIRGIPEFLARIGYELHVDFLTRTV